MFSCDFAREETLCRGLITFFHQWCPTALALIASTFTATAAPFIAPTEGVPPFRRDLLPINAEAMRSLGNNFLTLAQADSLEVPERRRAVAQAIALVQALDPKNETADTYLSVLLDGRKLSSPVPERVSRAKKKIWQTQTWLSTPEAGADANLLARLIEDSISLLDPEHPPVRDTSETAQQKEWQGWVAPVSAFKPEPVIEQLPVEKEPSQELPSKPDPVVKLAKASLLSVIQLLDPKLGQWTPQVVPLKMKAVPEDFGIHISVSEAYQWLIKEELTLPVEKALVDALGKTPSRGRIDISVGSPHEYPFPQNQTNISGPVWLLAHAALTGIEPDGLVIAEIDHNQHWVLPKFFWPMIMALAEGNAEGGRLVVPASAKEPMLNLLALEKPEFFLKYEVLTASTAEEFVKLTNKQPSEAQAAVAAKFKEIKDKAGDSPLGAYLANRFVRQRLQAISEEAPYHLSATLLAKQGFGLRPRYLTKQALAAELLRNIATMNLPAVADPYSVSSEEINALKAFEEQIRKTISKLERCTERNHTHLLDEAKTLADAAHNLSRKFADRGEIWERYDELTKAQRALEDVYGKLRKELVDLSVVKIQK